MEPGEYLTASPDYTMQKGLFHLSPENDVKQYRIIFASWPCPLLATVKINPVLAGTRTLSSLSLYHLCHAQILHLPTIYVQICKHTSIGIISIVNCCPSKMSVELIWSMILGSIHPRCLPGQEGWYAAMWL